MYQTCLAISEHWLLLAPVHHVEIVRANHSGDCVDALCFAYGICCYSRFVSKPFQRMLVCQGPLRLSTAEIGCAYGISTYSSSCSEIDDAHGITISSLDDAGQRLNSCPAPMSSERNDMDIFHGYFLCHVRYACGMSWQCRQAQGTLSALSAYAS